MGQSALAVEVPLLDDAVGVELAPPSDGGKEEGGASSTPTRNLGAELHAAALGLRDRGFYNPPQQLRRRAQAEGALEWLVNFVALTDPDVLPELGLPRQWVEFMLSQHDDLQLEAQRMVYLAQLATPERLGMLARARAAAMLYDAVTPQDWYFASRALASLPAWVLQGEDETSLQEGEGERRKTEAPSKTRSYSSALPGEQPRMNRAQRRRLEKVAGK